MKSLKGIIFSLLLIAVIVFLWFYRFDAAQLIGGWRNPDYQEFQALKLENESLKFQLATFQNQAVQEENKYLVGELYSFYPFSDQAKLIINLGEKDGLREGLAVLAADGIFLGKISAVKKNLSEVQTIFDSGWRSSVGIGENKIKALLVGGNKPALTLIAKEILPKVDDEVINLSPEYPYGLLIGRVSEVKIEQAEPWVSASLETFYNLNFLEKVLVVKE